MARLAWSCLYFHDVYEKHQYQGKSLLYWCKREVKFGAYWLLKTHIPAESGQRRSGKWGEGDQFVLMVRARSSRAHSTFGCFWLC
jgi:hypothetical protein